MTDQPLTSGSADPEERGGATTGESYVFGLTFDIRPVIYSIDGDRAVFEGDIVLGTVEAMAERKALVEAGSGEPDPLSAVAIPAGKARWADGVVPYELDPALPEAQQAAATNAVAHWNTLSRLSLVLRDASNAAGFPDFIRYSPGSGCSSPVGRQGGAQTVSLGDGCFFGQAVHETGHSIGLWHEQSREDRDQFVTIVFANVDPAQVHNFDQHITDGDDIGPYDYGSIMHYPATAFSINSQPTIVPKQAGVTIGQRTALSAGDRAGVRAMYPELEPSVVNTWIGDFAGDGRSEVLYYLRSRRGWYLGSWASGSLVFSQAGDTSGFGQLGDGRPFWVGDFDGDGADELLFHSPADGNWWLGQVAGTQLTWVMAGATPAGLGPVTDAKPFSVGRFTGGDATELLFRSATGGGWWLGSWSGTALNWTSVGSFTDVIAPDNLFWVGDFGDDGQEVLLTYVPASGDWWEGMYANGQLDWWQVGNSLSVARTLADGRPFYTGKFSQTDRVELLFYSPSDKDWWRGTLGDDALTWAKVGQGDTGDGFRVADFNGDGKAELVKYVAGVWRVGSWADDGQLSWRQLGNRPGFGDPGDGRPFWVGAFDGKTQARLLSYVSIDGHCWLGSLTGAALNWTLAATFEA
jgi:hypothetical protein